MKITRRQIIIGLIIFSLGFLNIYFILNTFFLGATPSSSNRKKETTLVEDFKNLQQAINSLGSRVPFTIENIATPSPSLNQKLIMEILNGSKIPGKANTVKNDLTEIEPNLEISTGNTEATSATTLGVKKTVPAELKKVVLEVLVKEFSPINEEGLPDDSAFDILLILGSK